MTNDLAQQWLLRSILYASKKTSTDGHAIEERILNELRKQELHSSKFVHL
jgi:hypothetical protein